MEIQDARIDSGKAFDWGKTSVDYAKYRDVYPEMFYKKIAERNLCVEKQKVLDLGTGTGVLPRNMYEFGAQWVGTDISENQIVQARRLSEELGQQIEYYAVATEDIQFLEQTFDVITACQCFYYFDNERVIPKLAKLLKQDGRLLVLYMSWLPLEDRIAGVSEALVLKYNPRWSGAGRTRHPVFVSDAVYELFEVVYREEYDVDVPFTRESWNGRVKACRGVGASLSPAEVAAWEKEHKALLEEIASETFNIKHQVAMLELKKRLHEACWKHKKGLRRVMEEKLYTAGELARLAGVSLRTIRFYDVKGLLKPVSYSEAGYRYYNQDSVERLQRILMMKYLGFSLQQIEEILGTNEDTEELLHRQKELLVQRKRRLEEMISTIEVMEKSVSTDRWGYLIRLLNLLTEDEKIKEQYVNAGNLEKRIRLHQGYSTATEDWTYWVYERLNLQAGQRVLEIGCGNGQLWSENVHNLPEGLRLTLSDRSEGMLNQTREKLAVCAEVFMERNIQVDFVVMDANELQLEPESFACIIANHMLYHVENKEGCFATIAKALKPAGIFCCATNGNNHMRELHELVAEFDERIEMPFMGVTSSFRLENGEEQLRKFFGKIRRDRHDNALVVDEPDAIYDYVYSYPGNSPYILDQRGEEFQKLLKERIENEGSIYIQKDCGMFVCGK